MKKYRGLYKMYYDLQNKEETKKLAEELRNSVSSISLTNYIGTNQGFIVYCDELMQELHAINNANLKIWALANRLPSVALQQFLSHAVIEEIHQTNEVENIHSTRKEIKDEMLVIQNGKKGKRFDGMIRKYQLLLQKDGVIPLQTCQDIRDLYDSFVLDEVVKEKPSDIPDGLYFRKEPVYVDKRNITVHTGVFPENAINAEMEKALSFLNNSDYDPLIRVSAFHYLFGYIHPFYNGNGRMSRFISSYCLSLSKIHYLVSLRLSYVIKSQKAQYYSMYKTTNDSRNFGDMTCFVIDFLRFIREACEQVQLFLEEKNELIRHYKEIIQNMLFEESEKDLLFVLSQVSICESDSLSLKELAELQKISSYKLNKRISAIEDYLILSYSGRAKYYRADLVKLDNKA